MTTDKKTKVKVLETKIKESKEQTFKRVAEPRVKAVLKALRILGNCSNHSNYAYSTEQVQKIFDSIDTMINSIQNKFTKSKKEQESFSFDLEG